MKKILICGANSYIGMSFEKYITENYPDKYSVDTVDMISDEWKSKDFSEFDSVLHVAGIAHRKETKENAELYYKVNRDLAFEAAQKAKNDGVKQFVFLSSMSVYGMETGCISKDTAAKPASNYGRSKLEAEKLIFPLQSEAFKIAVMRPPMIYGNGCRGNYNSLASIALKLPIFPKVKNQRSMLYIVNLCEFTRLLIENSESGLFFPQNAEYVNTTKMAELICLAHEKKLRGTKLFNWALAIAKKAVSKLNKAFGSLVYDISMSEYKENYNIVNFEDSIRATEAQAN